MPIDWKVFNQNCASFPLEEQARYGGQWVAFSFDGTHIVASSDESWVAVREILRSRGEDPNEYLIDYFAGPGDVVEGAVIVSRAKDRTRSVAPSVAVEANGESAKNEGESRCDCPTNSKP
jgi:hypothetical protein